MEQDTTKQRGPVKKEGRAQYCVILNVDAAEWAKLQPAGISGKLRELLDAAYKKAQASK